MAGQIKKEDIIDFKSITNEFNKISEKIRDINGNGWIFINNK
jgi:hypothetical protein